MEFLEKRIREKVYVGVSNGKKVFSYSGKLKDVKKIFLEMAKKRFPKIKLYVGEVTEFSYIKTKKEVQQ